MAWREVGDGALYARYDPWDVNVGVVRGSDGLAVVDSRGSHRQAEQLLADLAPLGGPVRAVVNSHWHFDHTFGNHPFKEVGAALWGHERLPSTLHTWFDDVVESLVFGDPDREDELREVECSPPQHLVRDAATIDLGDRGVEVRHLGRGHTDGDVIVVDHASGVVFAGDLIEQAGPPAYGDDSHPLEWPATAGALAGLVDDLGGPVVPGHGTAVDGAFCHDQAEAITRLADLLSELHCRGVPKQDVLAAGGDRWPFPADRLGQAVLRAWAQLD